MEKYYFGDCLEVMDSLIKEGIKFDAIITDPPYGTTACKWDIIIPFDEMWKRLKLLRKEKTPIILFGSEPFSSYLRMSNIKEYKYDWIWHKSQATGHLNAWRQPMRNIEIISVFYKKQSPYYPILKNKDQKNIRPHTNRTKLSDNYGEHSLDIHKCPVDKTMPATIIKFNNAQNTIHPTQKPVDLLRYLIKTYTKENDLILDFTCGSGTTGVAAKELKRNVILIDNGIDPKTGKKWIDISKERINKIEA